MNKVLLALIAAGIGSAWLGCSDSTPASRTTQQQGGSRAGGEFGAGTLVSMNVPNMFWGGCAASVRGDLQKIDGVTDIQTDIENRTCSFRLSDPDVDYRALLADFAETNPHLKDFEIQ